jgi:hypothetical protein
MKRTWGHKPAAARADVLCCVLPGALVPAALAGWQARLARGWRSRATRGGSPPKRLNELAGAGWRRLTSRGWWCGRPGVTWLMAVYVWEPNRTSAYR